MATRVVGSFFLSVHPTILFILLNPCYYNRTSCRLFIDRPQTFHSHSHIYILQLFPAIQNTSNFTSQWSGSISSTIHWKSRYQQPIGKPLPIFSSSPFNLRLVSVVIQITNQTNKPFLSSLQRQINQRGHFKKRRLIHT
ncbi:hypothetical protein HanPSC8_Chr12g0507421 [Helianthus annuus]|nr:hypothetical protein HanHA89_Chr12g0456261 [Helianthus annuus]KAJ0673867.1 hypothetical protein HanLR1_Chr12g0433691 [Helianthus annuus]KAJ0861505.1 hypothetical protein HanPSC8_Chr12g0507421 [Helianthus annuus]